MAVSDVTRLEVGSGWGGLGGLGVKAIYPCLPTCETYGLCYGLWQGDVTVLSGE